MQKYHYSRRSEEQLSSAFLNHQPKSIFNKVKYIGGCRPFNLFIYSNNYLDNNHLITLSINDHKLCCQIERGPFKSNKDIYLNQIKQVEISSINNLVQQKNGSLAGKAIQAMAKTGKLYTSFNELLLAKELKACDKLHYPEFLLTIAYAEKDKMAYLLFGFLAKALDAVKQFIHPLMEEKKAPSLKKLKVKVPPLIEEIHLN